MTGACVLGCAGLAVTRQEADLFRAARPWGFILFGRNIDSPDQVRALVESLRAAADRPDAPVLIDQEGGRVRRLRPPHWRAFPAASVYGAGGRGDGAAEDLARRAGRLIAHDLTAVGVNINCAPVLDLPAPGSHDVIGDRAFASTAARVAALGRAMAEGLLAGGVLPVVKHMPGHGRARVDSHAHLPVVEASRAELAATDLLPFIALAGMPMAMTAHVIYSAIDRRHPCTTSPAVISELIRDRIGFRGLLISDDLSMSALTGDLGERAARARSAGCDIALHCNGDLDEMKAVVTRAGDLVGRSAERADAAMARLAAPAAPWTDAEAAAAHARLRADLGEAWPA